MERSLLIDELESRRKVLNKERYYAQFQPLADLGYVPYSQIRDDMPVERREIIIRTFRKDYLKAGINLARVNYEHPGAYREYASMLNVAEEKMLHELVALNGAFIFHAIPVNHKSLFYRIAAFRCKLFGLDYNGNPQSSFRLLRLLLGNSTISSIQLLNMTGNLDLMIEAYLHACENKITHKIAFVKVDGMDPGEEVRKLINSPENDFVARLYQLFLWKNEFYNGRIDGDLGSMSKQSLKDLIHIVNKETERDLAIGNLTSGDGDLPYEIWNVGDLMRLYRSKSNILSMSQLRSVQLKSELPDGFPVEEAVRELGDVILDDSSKNRQSYFGNPEAFNLMQVGVIEDRIFKPLRRKSGNKRRRNKLLKRWLRNSGILKNTLRKLIQRLRKGLTMFLHGIRYLTGERTITTEDDKGTLMTQFDGDFDAVFFASGEVSKRAALHHSEKVKYLAFTLKQSLSFTGKVINVAWALTGPLGWYKVTRIAASMLEN